MPLSGQVIPVISVQVYDRDGVSSSAVDKVMAYVSGSIVLCHIDNLLSNHINLHFIISFPIGTRLLQIELSIRGIYFDGVSE